MTFLSKFIGVKADQTVNGALAALASLDPKGMTEAQIRQMDDNLTLVSRSVAAARVRFDKENQEAIAAKKAQDERFHVSDILVDRLGKETDPAKKAGLESDLNLVLADIEKFTPEVEREQQEADEAGDFLHLLEKTQIDAAEKLKTARARLQAAERDMERARIDRQTSAQMEQAAKQAAGIAQASGTLDTALKAMQANTDRDKLAASASRDKARLLGPKENTESENIRSALAEVRGTAATAHLSPADRLAALKAQRDRAA
jgi:hypothetical protein